MSVIINSFISLPLFWRAAILLFFIIVVIWKSFGRRILWILSIIPFLLQWFFRFLYLLLEGPVSLLHKKLGTSFYKISNTLSQYGEKIDSIIGQWYSKWHSLKKIYLWKILLAYVLCVAIIIFPSLMKAEADIYRTGENAYLYCERVLVDWFKKQEWYKSVESISLKEDIGLEQDNQDNLSELKPSNITLNVAGLKSSLLVRDIPSTTNSVELDRLYNGDIVIWSGELIFAEVNGEGIEPWVKVMTVAGIEGWTRLSYLYPERYNDVEFYVRMQE